MKSRRCRTCLLDTVTLNQINKQLRDGLPVTQIAKKWNIPYDSLRRHKESEHHLDAPKPTVEQVEKQIERVTKANADLTQAIQDAPDMGITDATKVLTGIAAQLAPPIIHALQGGRTDSAFRENVKILNTVFQTLMKMEGWLDTSQQVQKRVESELETASELILGVVCEECQEKILEALRIYKESSRPPAAENERRSADSSAEEGANDE